MSSDPPIPNFKAIIAEIGRMNMPFGKFGPAHYPPRGVPIYDLPLEYLAWFETNGYPKGRLGELIRIVYETRAVGGEAIFDECRNKAGGRTRFRKQRPKSWTFED